MQQVTEKLLYETVTRAIDELSRHLERSDFPFNQQDAALALHSLFEVFAKYPSQASAPNQTQAITQDLLIALHKNQAFWHTTELFKLIQLYLQPPFPGFSLMMNAQEHFSAFNNLKFQANQFYNKPTMQRARALNTINSPSIPTDDLHKLLTDTAFFDQQARTFSFDTPELKSNFYQTILENWLNHSIRQIPLEAVQNQYLELINAPEQEIKKKLKEYGLKVQKHIFAKQEQLQHDSHAQAVQQAQANQQPAPQAPAPLVPPKPIQATLFDALSPNAIAKMRMQALHKLIDNQLDIKVVKGLVESDITVLRSVGITNTSWMTVEQKKDFKQFAKTKLHQMENNVAVKTNNLTQFNVKLAAFSANPANASIYSNKLPDRLRKIFIKLSVSQQQNFLNKIDDNGKFLSLVFRAKSEAALRHYLGVNSNEPIISTEINEFLAVNQHDSLISGELNKYLLDLDPDIQFNAVTINDALRGYYDQLKVPTTAAAAIAHGNPNPNHTIISNLEWDLATTFHFNIPQDNLLALENALLQSAELYKALKNATIYKNNPSFCNFLLSIPKFQTLLVPLIVPGEIDRPDIVNFLFDRFKESNNKSEFLASIKTSDYSALAECFEHLQESEFTDLKNKTRTEDLAEVIKHNDPKHLEKRLKEEDEQFIKPLSKKFKHTQEMIMLNEQRILDIRNSVRLDQFAPQHASGRSQEIKNNITEMVDILDKLDADLRVQHAQWKEYKELLEKALVAPPQNFVSTPISDRIALIKTNITNNENIQQSLQDLRVKNGLLSNAEAKSLGHKTVLLTIQSVEEESQKHGSVAFLFTGIPTEIEVVDIGSNPPPISTKPIDNSLELDNKPTNDLTKKESYMPMLSEGKMYRKAATYLKLNADGTSANQTETVYVKKQGNKVTLEQKPAKEGELAALMEVVEFKLENHRRGSPIIVNGEYAAKCVELLLALKVPLEMIQIGPLTTYSKEDRGNFIGYGKTQEVKDAQAFVETPAAKARIEESLSNLKAYRPEAREKFLAEKAEISTNKSKDLADDFKMYKKKHQEPVADETEEYRPRTTKPGGFN